MNKVLSVRPSVRPTNQSLLTTAFFTSLESLVVPVQTAEEAEWRQSHQTAWGGLWCSGETGWRVRMIQTAQQNDRNHESECLAGHFPLPVQPHTRSSAVHFLFFFGVSWSFCLCHHYWLWSLWINRSVISYDGRPVISYDGRSVISYVPLCSWTGTQLTSCSEGMSDAVIVFVCVCVRLYFCVCVCPCLGCPIV